MDEVVPVVWFVVVVVVDVELVWFDIVVVEFVELDEEAVVVVLVVDVLVTVDEVDEEVEVGILPV